ncbi:right-handed parallel beta-helix repeat-containing protein [Rhizobium ruizarguesonis]|uniref:right-handed parallel beta-helix repeat-containing protein n=1 Tax=Rhizobium ruizarguesonis TaxID=2081791 RepID=UPI001031479C|nr:right-handed parallel beta-helix repeat-containing protein [Rhizobium ruizarguesonis]TBD43424.1 right-handed parallel beta-helix repeat-containing protein [Rhizobium ruizarguesonis]
MGRIRNAHPEDVHRKVRQLSPGDQLRLTAGEYKQPIVLSALVGSEVDPITICSSRAVLGSGLTFREYKKTGNELAAAQEAGGRFPGLYYLADNAALVLKNCQWINIEKLDFEGCWPTAVYLENCQHITLRGLKISGGTFAIGATGITTRHILIEDCDWVQDPSGNGWEMCEALRDGRTIEKELDGKQSELWRDVDWIQVHGERPETGKSVSIEDDARAYDGDFFRAWSIAGYVVIKNNVIADAFNGIHFFNQVAESIVESCSRNVLIEGNWFIRIRDNAIEPEHFAWNWTIRHNMIVDCYIPFSMQMARSGYFYVYGNVGWNLRKPGPDEDTHTRGQFFKFPTEHVADGPHYVFNNSWVLRAPLAKKMRFSNFVHVNNAIDYYETDPSVTAPFGKNFNDPAPPGSQKEETLKFEGEHFTRAWQHLGIKFDGDVVNHPSFPGILRDAGFPIGADAKGQSPNFANRVPGLPRGLMTDSWVDAVALTVLRPDGTTATAVDGTRHQVGAWQRNNLIRMEDPLFWLYWPGRKTDPSPNSQEPDHAQEIS